MIDINKINQLIADKYISVQYHPYLDLRILNYTPKCQYERYWTPETLACRGLVINSKDEIIARPFEKFFNYEEVKDIVSLNLSFEVFDKVDGSLGIIFKYANETVIATRGSFTSDQAVKAREILNKYPLFEAGILEGYTHLVEIIYPSNRIVIDYGNEEKLVLLSIIKTDTGNEISYDSIKSLSLLIPIVERYDGITDYNTIQEKNIENKEGVVIKFSNGFRMKIKYADYCRLHRIVTGVSSKTVWEHLKDGKSIDELIENVPDEFYDFVKSTQAKLIEQFNAIKFEVEDTYMNITCNLTKVLNQKEFAKEVFNKAQHISGLLFLRRENRNLTETIWKRLKPDFKQPFKEK